jgi:acyl-coenzyme A thioesterase PaaI-like protein
VTVDTDQVDRSHVIAELGLGVRIDGDGLAGSAVVVPEMHVPGTDVLRISVLAAWADVLTGLLSGNTLAPRVPVTLDLSVDLPRPLRGRPTVAGSARILKAGRSVVVLEVTFVEGDSAVALGTATFMPSPDTSLTLPAVRDSPALLAGRPERLAAPFAARAGCERRGPGVAELPRREDALNASNTINGGLIALLMEEAALSTAPGSVLSSLALRYLRPARVGPLVATATRHGDVILVAAHDAGADDRLVVSATARLTPA